MSTETLQEMESVLKLQKKLHIEEGPASIELRKDRLNRCIKMIKEYSDEIIDALQKDFGNRDPKSSFLTEIASTIGVLEHAIKNVDKWTKDELERPVPKGLPKTLYPLLASSTRNQGALEGGSLPKALSLNPSTSSSTTSKDKEKESKRVGNFSCR